MLKKTVFLVSVSAAWGACLLSHRAAASDGPADAVNAQSSSAQPSTSQSAPAATGGNGALAQLSQVVVTAQRRKQTVDRVPISISAFTGKQLVAVGVQNVQDLNQIAPGINITTTGQLSDNQFIIRGQSVATVGNGSPGVLIYQNDVPLLAEGSLIQTYDMDNVEVLKGPQGTLFGRNSIGGALLTYTKQPTWGDDGYAMMDLGSYDYRQFEGAQNIPIIDHKVALRIAAQVGSSGGDVSTFLYGDPTVTINPNGTVTATPGDLIPSTHNADAYAKESFRVSLLIQPTDNIRSVTVFDHSEIRGAENSVNVGVFPNGYQGGAPALFFLPPSVISAALGGGAFGADFASVISQLAQCGTAAVCDARLAGVDYGDAANQRVEATSQDPWATRTFLLGVSNTTSVEFGGQTLKNIFGYHAVDSYNEAPLTGLPIPIIQTASAINEEQLSDEPQLSGSFLDHNALKYTVGGFFYDDKPDGPNSLEVQTYFGLSHTVETNDVHNQSRAAYGQVDYSLPFAPSVTLTAGLRQTWDKQSVCTTSQTLSPFGTFMEFTSPDDEGLVPSYGDCLAGKLPNGVTGQFFPDASFSNLSYNLGVSWQINDDDMVYLTRRTGYRAGGYNTPAVDPYLEPVQTFKPETLAEWEIGAKTRWHFGQVGGLFNLALFSGKDTDNQLPVDASNTAEGLCIPQAIGSAGRAANCTTTSTESTVYAVGTPGVLVTNGVDSFLANAATLTISGFDVEADVSPVSWLTLGANGTFVNVKLDSISVPTALNTFVDAAGLPIPSSVAIYGQPKWIGNANAVFNYPREVLGGDLNALVNFHYNSSFAQSGVVVPGYTNTNLRINLEDIEPNLRLTLYVNNVFNTQAFTGSGASAPQALGESGFTLGPPRVIGVEVAYSWGGH